MRARPVCCSRIGIQNVVLPAQITHVFHSCNTFRRSKVADPTSCFILIFKRALANTAEIPCYIRKQPATVRFACRENKTCLACLFTDDLSIFSKFLQCFRINRKSFFVDQSGFAEQFNIDMHAKNIAITGQAIDTAVLIREHFNIRRTEFFKYSDFRKRIGNISNKILADQQLGIREWRLKNIRCCTAFCHRNIIAQ